MDHANSQDLLTSQDIRSDEIIVSYVRPGMKREFSMMMRTQSVIGVLPVGRRRVTRSQTVSSLTKNDFDSGDHEKIEGFETKKIGKDAEEKRGRKGTSKSNNADDIRKGKGCFVDVGIDERSEIQRDIQSAQKPQEVLVKFEPGQRIGKCAAGTSASSVSKLDRTVPKSKVPTKLKDLLQTSLLEGLHVCYIQGSKLKGHAESGLRGVIRGSGIQCFCDECKGKKVVTPSQYELHAHSRNKRPAEYMYLENGRNLRDVLEACKNDTSGSVKMAIQKAVGSSACRMTAFCVNCKEIVSQAGSARLILLCDSCAVPKSEISGTSGRQLSVGSSSATNSSSKSVIRAPESTEMSSSSKQKARGQLTKKDSRMHKLVFEKNGLPDGTRLSYIINGKTWREGYIKDGAIFCLCCNKLVSPSRFEAHAGFGSRRSPYKNIFTSSEKSLHEVSVHLSKNCGMNQHRVQIVGTIEDESGGCDLCRKRYFTNSGFNDHTIIICDQCEKEYHVGCLNEKKSYDLKELPENKWFCCTQCRNISSSLQKFIMDGEQMLPKTCLNLLKKKHDDEATDTSQNVIKWRLLNGDMGSEDDKEWLSKAFTLFHDRFGRIADPTSHVDLVAQMVYGQSSKGHNYGGMYCALLMLDSFVVSAALIRIFGQEVAELPLVATSSEFEGKGYVRSLFICINNLLASLNVKNLVLPATHEAELMWRNKFGFENEVVQYKENYPMVEFGGTSVLCKSVSN